MESPHSDNQAIAGSGHTTRLQSLLRQHADGNETFSAEIIEHACERLERLTRKMLNGYRKVKRWEETGDVLQNAMIRLHRSLTLVKPASPRQFYGLAATQIRRELIDLARRHYAEKGIGANHDTDHQSGLPRVEKATSLEPRDLDPWCRFHEAIESLPSEQREVFDLLWYEGMTQPEASALLGVSLKTVKRRWQAARIALHALMRGEVLE